MTAASAKRVAWLIPDVGTGGISFQHIIAEFVHCFPETVTFTGRWPGFAAGYEEAFTVREVGAWRYIRLGKTANGYDIGFSYISPVIVWHLLRYRPAVIFANAFSVWTLLALLMKPLLGCKVAIICEGSSPGVDYRESPLRIKVRRLMVSWSDVLMANGNGAKAYLVDGLGADPTIVRSRPFLVPSIKALTQCDEPVDLTSLKTSSGPVFLCVGQLVARKGIETLLAACARLEKQGLTDYTLLLVGDGEQRAELESFAANRQLTERIVWTGKVPYGCLGEYFQQAHVSICPTNEDIWGMVIPEAMAFGNAILCSAGAGAVELVEPNENGFVFAPRDVETLANAMAQLLKNPDLIQSMGQRSRQIMAEHTPKHANQSFEAAVVQVLSLE